MKPQHTVAEALEPAAPGALDRSTNPLGAPCDGRHKRASNVLAVDISLICRNSRENIHSTGAHGGWERKSQGKCCRVN